MFFFFYDFKPLLEIDLSRVTIHYLDFFSFLECWFYEIALKRNFGTHPQDIHPLLRSSFVDIEKS